MSRNIITEPDKPDDGGQQSPRRTAKGSYRSELRRANDAAAGTDFITGREHGPADGGKHTAGRRNFGFYEEGKGSYDPVTGRAIEHKPKEPLDKAAIVDEMVLPRAAGRGPRPPPEAEPDGDVDPITGKIKPRAPHKSSSSGSLAAEVKQRDPAEDIISGKRRASPGGGGGRRQSAAAQAADDGQDRDPITGELRQKRGQRSSAGAMNAFMTDKDSKGNIIG